MPAPHSASGQLQDGTVLRVQGGVPLGPAAEGLGFMRWPAHLGPESQGLHCSNTAEFAIAEALSRYS